MKRENPNKKLEREKKKKEKKERRKKIGDQKVAKTGFPFLFLLLLRRLLLLLGPRKLAGMGGRNKEECL